MLYAQLFADCLPDMRKYLDVLFATIFQSWGPLVLVAIEGEDDYRAVDVSSDLAPFCAAINNLGLRDRCFECDRKIAHEVARSRKSFSYWCDWGMRIIAVPILIHDVTVGVILCGQKRLEGDDDLEGQRLLEKFADENGLDNDLQKELREQRNLCPAVSPSQVKEMVDIFMATSLFISQILYSKLEEATRSVRDADTLKDLFAGFGELDRNPMILARFWNALDKQLEKLSTMFDSRCIAVVLEAEGEYRVLASHSLERVKFQLSPDAHLISSTKKDFTGPEYLTLTGPAFPDCFLTSLVRETYSSVNVVVFDKARLGADRILHLLVYFDSTIPRHNRLFMHQIEQVMSLFLRETANSFLHAERVEQLQKELAVKDAMLLDVVHQINQPLQGILADCENLASSTFSLERKDRITRNLPFRVKHLAREVKSVQYAEKGGMLRPAMQNFSSVNLSKLLIEAAIDFQGYADEKSVRIEVDRSASDSLGEVLIGREHLGMALMNVLFNAVKYSFPGTIITIRPDLANQQLRILVTDHGIEIEPSERESIFRKHMRTGRAKAFSQSGLGIGLFVTSELMRGMGGDAVVVESCPTGRVYEQFHEHRTTIALKLPQSVVLKSGGTK